MKAFKSFRLDTVNHCLWREDERAQLTPKAFDVLRYLVEHADRLVSQDELLEALWPETYVNPEGIRKYILEVRKALSDPADKPVFIETLPKRGYQFIAPVTDEGGLANRSTVEPHIPENIVGRQAGLTELDRDLQKALSGQRQVVFLTGEAGIGKTTLVDAFERHARRQPGARVARGQCIEGFGGIEAYYPMLEALGSLLRDPDNGSVAQTLAKRAPTWLIQFPALVTSEQRESLQREILGSTRERMVREICEALEIITAQAPLIVILEDLHWVDHSTLDLISAVARRREPARLLLIGTYRPVDVVLSQSPLKTLKRDLLVRSLCHEIAIERLEESDVSEYLTKVFSVRHLPAGLSEVIHRNSGGNPLFMAAIVQDMTSKGLIEERGGQLALTAPLSEIYPGIPETLQQMLEIQLEQLRAEEQLILQCGSIAGERFSVWSVASMIEESPAAIEAACEKLGKKQQFIRSAGVHAEPDGTASSHYEFRHALYRQALCRSIPDFRYSKMHTCLGERLMAICGQGRPDLASAVASHFEEARDHERAARFLMLAAEHSVRRVSYRDSMDVLRHALELSARLPEAVRNELEVEVLTRIADAHYALGEMSDSATIYERAAELTARTRVQRSHVCSLVHWAIPLWHILPERGNEVGRQAVELSRELADPVLAARTQLVVGSLQLLYDKWRPEDAELCARAERTCEESGAGLPPDVFYVYVRALQGDYEEAYRLANLLTNTTPNPYIHLQAIGAKGLIDLYCGRFGEVLRMVTRGLEMGAKDGGDPWLYNSGDAWLRLSCFDFEGVQRASNRLMRNHTEQHAAFTNAVAGVSSGYAELYQANYDRALQCFAAVRDPLMTPKFFLHWYWRMQAALGSAETRLSAGDLEGARCDADVFLKSALALADPNMHALAWEIQARIARAANNAGRAWSAIGSALAVLEKFEIPASAWQVHRTAWDFSAADGDRERAGRHRARAQEVILKIADSFEPGEPLRESFLSAPPVRRILSVSASA